MDILGVVVVAAVSLAILWLGYVIGHSRGKESTFRLNQKDREMIEASYVKQLDELTAKIKSSKAREDANEKMIDLLNDRVNDYEFIVATQKKLIGYIKESLEKPGGEGNKDAPMRYGIMTPGGSVEIKKLDE